MVATSTEEFVEHFGKKGMKWGTRNAAKTSAKADKKAAKEEVKSDKKFVRNANSKFFKVYNAATKNSDAEIDRINNKPQYKNADFRRDSPLRQKYFREHADAFEKLLNDEASKQIGISASGKKTVEFVMNDINSFPAMYIIDAPAKHSQMDNRVKVDVTYDAMGHILAFDIKDDSMTQGMNFISELFVEHHGVKGMHWGVRSGKSNKPSGRGSKKNETKTDIKKLSDAELRTAINRMNLEQQFSNLSKSPAKKAGKDFAQSILTNVARTTLTGVVTAVTGKAVSKIIKK